MAGPYSAALLADLGADVIKVEKPRRGDLIRFTDRNVAGSSGYFLGLNRGKRGLTADLRKPEGQEIIRRLARSADVLVENYRGGKMSEWHLGYAELREVNPRLIYCSLSMFPNDVTGYDQLVGNDKTAQAITGLMDNTGEADGEPTRLGAPIVDASGGFLCAIGILAALHARERTGQGDHVLISLLEAAYALMPPWIPSILNSDVQFTRQGNKHPLLAPYQLFKTADNRYMVVGAFHNESWRRLCQALGRPDLIEDERFTDNMSRVANRNTLDSVIEAEIVKRTAAELQKLLEEHSVPAAPVMSIRDSVEMFTSIAPQMISYAHHDEIGELRQLRAPIRLGSELDAPPETRPAPLLGHDTDEILQANGYSAEEITALRERHVI
jgi:crotonobetainyl-CoA:carnitine CoA-transferase CaiB-like acyl-CoA transferase